MLYFAAKSQQSNARRDTQHETKQTCKHVMLQSQHWKNKLDHHGLEQISKKKVCVLGTVYVNRTAWIRMHDIACWDRMSC